MTEVPGGTAWIGDTFDHLRPGEMRYNLWSTIAHGATSVSPWQFKPERIGPEVGTFGLVEMDGASTYRTDELEDFVRAIRRHERLFLDARPPAADCAVLFSPESSVAVSSVQAAVLQRTLCMASWQRCGGRASTSIWSARPKTWAGTRSSICPCRG